MHYSKFHSQYLRVYTIHLTDCSSWKREKDLSPDKWQSRHGPGHKEIEAYGQRACRSICTLLSAEKYDSIRGMIIDAILDDGHEYSSSRIYKFLDYDSLYVTGVQPRKSWWTTAYLGATCGDLLFNQWSEEAEFIVQDLHGLRCLKECIPSFFTLDYFESGRPMVDVRFTINVLVDSTIWNHNDGRLHQDFVTQAECLLWLYGMTQIHITFTAPKTDLDVDALKSFAEKTHLLFYNLYDTGGHRRLRFYIGEAEICPKQVFIRGVRRRGGGNGIEDPAKDTSKSEDSTQQIPRSEGSGKVTIKLTTPEVLKSPDNLFQALHRHIQEEFYISEENELESTYSVV